ncbi:hypothetical protein AB5I41_11580 [Sphingomonas sp. MMS24-JH45]
MEGRDAAEARGGRQLVRAEPAISDGQSTELSAHVIREWSLPGSNMRWRIALHHQGSDAEADAFAAKAKKVVAEQVKLFGAPRAL